MSDAWKVIEKEDDGIAIVELKTNTTASGSTYTGTTTTSGTTTTGSGTGTPGLTTPSGPFTSNPDQEDKAMLRKMDDLSAKLDRLLVATQRLTKRMSKVEKSLGLEEADYDLI